MTYALLQSIYEYMIVLKTRELESAGSEPTPAYFQAGTPEA
jgi:hypothetical protein